MNVKLVYLGKKMKQVQKDSEWGEIHKILRNIYYF